MHYFYTHDSLLCIVEQIKQNTIEDAITILDYIKFN
jgi:hypothetical protein